MATRANVALGTENLHAKYVPNVCQIRLQLAIIVRHNHCGALSLLSTSFCLECELAVCLQWVNNMRGSTRAHQFWLSVIGYALVTGMSPIAGIPDEQTSMLVPHCP